MSVAAVWESSIETAVDENPKRPNIDAIAVRLVEDHLWRHVSWRATRAHASTAIAQDRGQPEVAEFDGVAQYQEILRLHIPVDHVATVNVAERDQALLKDRAEEALIKGV